MYECQAAANRMAVPARMQRIAETAPNFAKAQKPTLHLSPAPSATIMFATEPKIVRLPAIVLTKAKRYQNNSEFSMARTLDEAKSTKGTLDKRFEPTKVIPENIQTCSERVHEISSNDFDVSKYDNPLVCKPPITTKRAEKKSKRDQSILAKSEEGSLR